MELAKEHTLKELLFQNITPNIEYDYNYSNSTIGPERRVIVNIFSYTNQNKNIKLISNPVIVIELDEDSELEFDVNGNIIKEISIEIGGSQIDKLYDKQIQIYNTIYGFEIKKSGSKVFLPIPFGCMVAGHGILVSECRWHESRLWITFGSSNCINMIKNFSVRTEIIVSPNKLNYSITNDYYKKLLFEEHKNSSKNNYDYKKEQIVRHKFNQFCGLDDIINSNCKVRCGFNHNTDRFFIYFQNKHDLSIYWNIPQFEKLSIFVNGYGVKNYTYETLQKLNSKEILGYVLPKGVFEIKWDIAELKNLSRIDNLTIELSGLMVPQDIAFGICAESTNYLHYLVGMVETMYKN